MTVFTTPFWKSRPDARAFFRLLALAVLLLCAPLAGAAEIEVKSADITLGEDAWQIDAEFGIDLGHYLEEVVSRGVALYFVAEFDLTKARWFWMDEHVAGRKQTWRLSYNALTRQYRLSSGALHQNFATLGEALGVLARLRNWAVADKAQLKTGEPYNAALRLKLDLTQLPKPFQVTAIGNKDWNITAEVKRWSFTPPSEGTAK